MRVELGASLSLLLIRLGPLGVARVIGGLLFIWVFFWPWIPDLWLEPQTPSAPHRGRAQAPARAPEPKPCPRPEPCPTPEARPSPPPQAVSAPCPLPEPPLCERDAPLIARAPSSAVERWVEAAAEAEGLEIDEVDLYAVIEAWLEAEPIEPPDLAAWRAWALRRAAHELRLATLTRFWGLDAAPAPHAPPRLLGVLYPPQPTPPPRRPTLMEVADARQTALQLYRSLLEGRGALPPAAPVEDPALEEAVAAQSTGTLGVARGPEAFYVFEVVGPVRGWRGVGDFARLQPEIAAQLGAALNAGRGRLDWEELAAAGFLWAPRRVALDGRALPLSLTEGLALLPIGVPSAPLVLDGELGLLRLERRTLYPHEDRLYARTQRVPFFEPPARPHDPWAAAWRALEARLDALEAAPRRLEGAVEPGLDWRGLGMAPGDLQIWARAEGLWLLYLEPGAPLRAPAPPWPPSAEAQARALAWITPRGA